MKKRQTSVFALLLISISLLATSANAQETYVCQLGNEERKISIVYDNPAQPVPCEVIYEKSDDIQSLWKAKNEIGYCETKATEFVEKQRGWGWDCALMTQ